MDVMENESPWLGQDEQDLWQALLTIVIALPAALDRQLQRDAGISNFEYGALAQLSNADEGTMRIGELAHLCDGTLPRLSKLMDRFEAREWVIRRPDPTDGRYTLAALTDAGRQKIIESAPEHVATVRQLVFEPLSVTQRRALGAGLNRISANLRRATDSD